MENEKFDLSTEQAPADLVAVDGEMDFIADLSTARRAYCSLTAEDDESRAKLFNATNNTHARLQDLIGETLEIRDIFVEQVTCTSVNEDTGEVRTKICPRVVLIDPAGVGYGCVSVGIFGAVKKLLAIFGEPSTWSKPRKLKIRQITMGAKRILTFDVIE